MLKTDSHFAHVRISTYIHTYPLHSNRFAINWFNWCLFKSNKAYHCFLLKLNHVQLKSGVRYTHYKPENVSMTAALTEQILDTVTKKLPACALETENTSLHKWVNEYKVYCSNLLPQYLQGKFPLGLKNSICQPPPSSFLLTPKNASKRVMNYDSIMHSLCRSDKLSHTTAISSGRRGLKKVYVIEDPFRSWFCSSP